jgi:hypothetical protein
MAIADGCNFAICGLEQLWRFLSACEARVRCRRETLRAGAGAATPAPALGKDRPALSG